PPVALATWSVGGSVDISFDEKLDPRANADGGTANEPFNYVVESSGVTASVVGATLMPGGQRVRLTVTGLDVAHTYSVTISGVSDYTENNAIGSQTISGQRLPNYSDVSVGGNAAGYTRPLATDAAGEFTVVAGGIDI